MSGLNWIYQWYHMITVYRCAATGTDTDCRFLRRKTSGQIRLPRWKLSRMRVSDSLCFARDTSCSKIFTCLKQENRGARPRLSAFSAKMLLNVHYAAASLPSIWLLRVAMYSSALSASMTLVPQSTKLSTFSPFRCATTVLTA